jgi:hypothetical protein
MLLVGACRDQGVGAESVVRLDVLHFVTFCNIYERFSGVAGWRSSAQVLVCLILSHFFSFASGCARA